MHRRASYLKTMKTFTVLIAAFLILLVFSTKNHAALPAGPRTPVLVELFTSEGCSSCPPADRLLIDLKRNQPVANAQVIALGLHVDYWNYIGWNDRFSSPRFTARQQQYADRLNDGPYTPQMIVDGSASVVGNDANSVSRAITRAASSAKPVQVELSQQNGAITVKLHGVAASSPEVFFALVEDDLESSVIAGENNGVTLHHVAVARDLRSLGHASSDSWSATVPLQLASGVRREKSQALVFVQDQHGKVLGVASASIQ
jgi:hypothetical protein